MKCNALKEAKHLGVIETALEATIRDGKGTGRKRGTRGSHHRRRTKAKTDQRHRMAQKGGRQSSASPTTRSERPKMRNNKRKALGACLRLGEDRQRPNHGSEAVE
jgi:hypothetical protein